MATLRPLTVDRADYQINGLLAQRMWRLIKPYWVRKGAWPSWLAAAGIVLILPTNAVLSVLISFVTKNMTNALIAKHAPVYWRLFWTLFAVGMGMTVLTVTMAFIAAWLNQNWRRWLTKHLVDQYLSKRTYYDIALAEDLDNPDQRIQENVTPFITTITSFPQMIILNIAILVANAAVLATINTHMLPVVLIFGLAQSVAMYFAYIPTVRKNFEIQVAEADLRYGILHVRDNAEAVAFYGGEDAERKQIWERLKLAARKNLSLLYYNAGVVDGMTGALGQIWKVLPYLILVPLFLGGHLTYGAIMQGVSSATAILLSLELITRFVPLIATAAPQAVRLAQIQERFDLMETARLRDAQSRLTVARTADRVRMQHVSLQTPGGEQSLIRDLSLTVERGDHMVVVGQTGVGKSSLLRAMAGLWTRGEGAIEMPTVENSMFLPQRPYMILADLRSQLLYPHHPKDVSDATLEKVLQAVSLPDLAAKYGGLSAVRDWGKVLSLGEQQRIGFARILISRPQFVFLDEATSAVDFETEATLYDLLGQTGASYISVGHRLSILDYHSQVLTLIPGGTWKVETLSRAALEDAQALLAE